MRMTTEEAFVKVLQMHGIEHAFGIIGSAFMPISDYFPRAGIKFWDVAHECSGGYIADGYTRTTGKMAMIIAQNGPGITNFVTCVKTAYWNHTPMLLVTPQAANKTIGQRRFTTYERVEEILPLIIKKDGRREAFDRDKVLVGLKKAVEKRPVSAEQLEQVIVEIEQRLQEAGEKEVGSAIIGEHVMRALQRIDDVAYVRFASVYRSFRDVKEFMVELQDLLTERGVDEKIAAPRRKASRV
jgi:transcriptional regulator NrdR